MNNISTKNLEAKDEHGSETNYGMFSPGLTKGTEPHKLHEARRQATRSCDNGFTISV